ncbi:hypothetical protein CDAR_306961 [Caerostris darwini]|uniref:Reverse transcriptase domain-containing protein n=1 Tax=Caerostris darwini TaxID=1538125 RepID=A0AAV4QEP3_9ARAC|nr:hypothetical protein CDAR_306961 [Caerostris darwini]
MSLLNITKCYRTIPTEALYILAGVPPLHITIRNLLRLYLLRAKHQDLSTGNVSVNVNDLEKISTILPPWESFKIKRNYFPQENTTYSIYTDGSKIENNRKLLRGF